MINADKFAISLAKLSRHRRVIQFLEYMVGGGVYFWGGILIFAALYSGFGWHWLPAKAVADILGWSANYLIQRYWAFYDRRLKGHNRRVVRRFVIINILDLLIDYSIIFGLQLLGITPYVGFFVSAGVTTVWDYLWYRFWVFKPEPRD